MVDGYRKKYYGGRREDTRDYSDKEESYIIKGEWITFTERRTNNMGQYLYVRTKKKGYFCTDPALIQILQDSNLRQGREFLTRNGKIIQQVTGEIQMERVHIPLNPNAAQNTSAPTTQNTPAPTQNAAQNTAHCCKCNTVTTTQNTEIQAPTSEELAILRRIELVDQEMQEVKRILQEIKQIISSQYAPK